MFKKLKKSRTTMFHQLDNSNKETEITFKKNQLKILQLKSTVTEMKYSEVGLYIGFEQAEERTSHLECK